MGLGLGCRMKLKLVPTINTEIRKFLGLIVWMELVIMPEILNHWSNDEMFANCFAKSVKSKNRLEVLLRMIHFSQIHWQIVVNLV